MPVQLNRKTTSLLGKVNGEINPRNARPSKYQQHTTSATPPRRVESPANFNDSPISSGSDIPVRSAVIDTNVQVLSDDDLPSSSPPQCAKRPRVEKRNQINGKKGLRAQVLRSPGKKVEHHRERAVSDAQSSGSLKRKRDTIPNVQTSAAAEREDSPIFGDVFDYSQKVRKQYGGYGGSSQSRAPASSTNIHAAPLPTNLKHNGTRPLKHGKGNGNSPEPKTKETKNGFEIPTFLNPPTIQLTSILKPTFKDPRNGGKGPINIADDSNSSSLSSIHNSSPSQSPLKEISFSISANSSPLSSPPGSSNLSDSRRTTDFSISNFRADSPKSRSQSPVDSTMVKCPMCKNLVDRDFLESFAQGRRMRNREALRFCEAHQHRTAQKRWGDAQYPVIDWDGLDERLAGLHFVINDIVGKQRISVYRQEVEAKIAANTGRNFLRDQEAGGSQETIPGYYGSKGARRMMDYIMRVFGRKLRKESANDAIFRTVGVSGFAQMVLIPEIACCLVMEDMEVSEERAREILKESAGVGELVNAEEEEVVVPVESGYAEDSSEDVVDEIMSEDEESSLNGDDDRGYVRQGLGREGNLEDID